MKKRLIKLKEIMECNMTFEESLLNIINKSNKIINKKRMDSYNKLMRNTKLGKGYPLNQYTRNIFMRMENAFTTPNGYHYNG